MKLIVQPDDGLTPVMKAVQHAKTSIDLVVFRFDRVDLEKALAAAVTRGVVVRVLIAYTNGGGEKLLRKLEPRLLQAGVTVTRTADDLPRYHGKMTIIDDALFVLGFNFTRQDIERSRSFGLITHDKTLIQEAASLFEADSTRQPYSAGHDQFVVSPESSRERLTAVIEKTRRQLLVYSDNISDKLMLRLIRERAAAGVEIRVIGKLARSIPGVATRKLADMRLHVRALISDGATVFVGSQGLRKPEMDERREIGLIARDARIARKMQAVFEADWALTKVPRNEADDQNDDDLTGEAAVG